MSAALQVRELAVHAGAATLVQGVSFELGAGQALCVLGESGSGKSLMVQALMASLPAGLRSSGEVRLQGRVHDEAARRAAWGRQIALLPQEPSAALDPSMRAWPQVAEVYRWLRGLAAPAARQQAQADLARLGLPAAAQQRHPHQLSGGMAQRVALAATLAGGTPLLVVDEPTKGLDTERRDQVLALLQAAMAAGAAVLAITHDVAVARALGGQLLVMRGSQVIEQGPASERLRQPQHDYTRALLAADPATWAARPAARPDTGRPVLLQAHGLALQRGGQQLFEGVNLAVRAGERWAIQGPSGAGKTSLGQVLLGLLRPSAGQVLRAPQLPRLGLQKLYQDPLAAFAPHITLGTGLADFLRLHRLPAAALHALRERLGLPAALLQRLPQAVSGGELQRLALLRVMLLKPALLFADEPSSRLDPITQRDVLQLLQAQLDAEGTALLLVTHDAALAAHVAEHRLQLGATGKHLHASAADRTASRQIR
ncbi:ABC transporter ATP-binding protein [Aquabacterium sp. OR-4]|uniref:ABC transporter ATP-binding protein n=1 Tax=Aquabacterium sp. OR-4 TaxID=2978127 RepID=UPI0021B20714|nr:ATP-binding cassette domain-containing protein [Aquabacterium sp. OR-4]MDT7835344.1 ATP-binding cassette domain-containing protein [Aquabacterium sp. OR-4]